MNVEEYIRCGRCRESLPAGYFAPSQQRDKHYCRRCHSGYLRLKEANRVPIKERREAWHRNTITIQPEPRPCPGKWAPDECQDVKATGRSHCGPCARAYGRFRYARLKIRAAS